MDISSWVNNLPSESNGQEFHNRQYLLNGPRYISSESPMCLFPKESLVFPTGYFSQSLVELVFLTDLLSEEALD